MGAMSALPLVFMGSDPISCPFLRALLAAEDLDVRLVVTKNDKEVGRRVQSCALRCMVRKEGIDQKVEVIAPTVLNADDTVRRIAECEPQLIVVVAYGKILKAPILSTPPLGCLNMHLSLLPSLRGAAPITRAILNGLPRTGVTAMRMAEGLDNGPIYAQRTTDIRPDDNHDTLTARLVELGVPLMLETIRSLRDGTAVATAQDDSLATEAKKLKRDEWVINWGEDADAIERRVRAFAPDPACTAYLPPKPGFHEQLRAPTDAATFRSLVGPVLKVLGVEVLPDPAPAEARPSQIVAIEKKGVVVAAGDGRCVRLTCVKPFGKPRPLNGAEFVNGYRSKMNVGDKMYPVLQTPWD